MAHFILITEPARGTSIRIEVPETRESVNLHGHERTAVYCDYDRAMREWMQEHDKLAWQAFCDDCRENGLAVEDGDAVYFYRDYSGDDVQMIEETANY